MFYLRLTLTGFRTTQPRSHPTFLRLIPKYDFGPVKLPGPSGNRPQASEWQRGCSWSCFVTDLTPFIVQIKLFLCWLVGIYMRKAKRSVWIKARSPPASLAFIGQVTKHTTVKWPISLCSLTWLDSYLGYIFPSNSGEGHKNMNVWVLTIIK